MSWSARSVRSDMELSGLREYARGMFGSGPSLDRSRLLGFITRTHTAQSVDAHASRQSATF